MGPLLKYKPMENKKQIYEQHAENSDWINRLEFYKEEIEILKERLAEIANKNSSKSVLSEVEHFQNQFIVQRNNIDEIGHLIKLNEQLLENEVNKNEIAVDHRSLPYHIEEKEKLEGFESNISNLRKEFNTFSSKWM